jgi:anaerobic magnesium-protoporphyrin IX monomethyl ester cyclase
MKKIALIQPNYRHARTTGAWMVNPPIGLAYIAALLEKEGLEVSIIDANAENLSPKQTAEKVRKFEIIGISLMTPAHGFAIELIKHLPKKTIKIAGGPHATGYPEIFLNAGYDAVVIGEGEYTFLDIAKGEPFKNIKGIAYRKGKRIYKNQMRELCDPNELPFPARHLLKNNGVDLPYISTATKYRPWSPIFTSRGCPFSCYYCNKSIFGQGFRPRNPENAVAEIEELVTKYHVREIDVYDDCFNFDIKRAENILDLIIKKNIKIHIRFSNGIRVDKITESLLKKMKNAGCEYIAYGVESGNQGILNSIPKGITLDMVRKAVRLTKKQGIHVTCFFMLGLVEDTKETMQQTIDFAKELEPDIAQFTLATPYPGTRMYQMIKERGTLLVDDWSNFHHTLGKMLYRYPGTATPEEVEEMYRKAHNEFYFRPKYMMKQILKIRSLEQIRIMLRGLKAIMYIRNTQN